MSSPSSHAPSWFPLSMLTDFVSLTAVPSFHMFAVFCGKLSCPRFFVFMCFVLLCEQYFPVRLQVCLSSILTLRSISVPFMLLSHYLYFWNCHVRITSICKILKYICFLFLNMLWSYESPFLEILQKIEKYMWFFSVTDLSMPMFGTEDFKAGFFFWKS